MVKFCLTNPCSYIWRNSDLAKKALVRNWRNADLEKKCPCLEMKKFVSAFRGLVRKRVQGCNGSRIFRVGSGPLSVRLRHRNSEQTCCKKARDTCSAQRDGTSPRSSLLWIANCCDEQVSQSFYTWRSVIVSSFTRFAHRPKRVIGNSAIFAHPRFLIIGNSANLAHPRFSILIII